MPQSGGILCNDVAVEGDPNYFGLHGPCEQLSRECHAQLVGRNDLPLCLKVQQREPPELPSPTPVHISFPLGKGVKVGIAVGVIVGVLLIAVALSFVIMRMRRWKASAEGSRGFDADTGKEDNKHGVAQLLGDGKYEIVGDNRNCD